MARCALRRSVAQKASLSKTPVHVQPLVLPAQLLRHEQCERHGDVDVRVCVGAMFSDVLALRMALREGVT